MNTQWYCLRAVSTDRTFVDVKLEIATHPPLVGAMLPISAILEYTAKKPIQHTMYMYIVPATPPLKMDMTDEPKPISHDAIKIMLKLIIGKRRNMRYT
jgi:hypothetical protein